MEANLEQLRHAPVSLPDDVIAALAFDARANPERHPTIDNVNAMLTGRLTAAERICRKIAAWTGAPIALVGAIAVQFTWIAVGLLTNWDPYPFMFLLTCSNVLQL